MFYYYKIENSLNGHKYIGITEQPDVRKNRHFQKLRQQKHFNPHLQAAFNKYGEENFYFEIIESSNYSSKEEAYFHEAELIKEFDSIKNGYNCNPGGLWTGPRGRFTKEEVFYIRSACYFEDNITGVLGKIYNCPGSTINNIRIGRNYKPWCEEFDTKTEEEKQDIYDDFCEHTKFHILKLSKGAKARKLTKEQVFLILLCEETHFTTFMELKKLFKVREDHRYNFEHIRNGSSYKDYVYEYKLLNNKDKEQLLCLYAEMCNEKSL